MKQLNSVILKLALEELANLSIKRSGSRDAVIFFVKC